MFGESLYSVNFAKDFLTCVLHWEHLKYIGVAFLTLEYSPINSILFATQNSCNLVV